MKIILEQRDLPETEVVIRGDVGSSKVQELIKAVYAAEGVGKLFLYKGEKEYLFSTAEITYFSACQNKVYAHVGKEEYEIHNKLYEVAEMLYRKGFIQINKGVVVNVNAVQSVEAEFSGNYTALLKNRNGSLNISRKYMKAFRNYVMEER